MLILTRRIGEKILIDNGKIEVSIIYVRNGHIALGIKAPRNIDIDRKEIFTLLFIIAYH